MARKNTKRLYLQELDKLEPTIRRSYLRWVGDRVGIASIKRVEEFIAGGDIDGILRHLEINEASLSEFTESIRDSYKAGGMFEAPAAQVTFDIRSRGAENWIRSNSSRLVRGITSSQRDAVQDALETGMRLGTNPRTTALDIVGRIGASGKRTGGIVGLTSTQARYVTNARAQLRSGDPAQMAEYFTRDRRDKRFDGLVRRAIREGRPLTVAETNKVTGSYSNRLLKLRGDTIARTESTAAFNAARDQAWQQSVDEGKVDPNTIVNTWSATMDNRTRDSHRSMNGQQRTQGVPFISPTGALLLYPGDTSYGAGAEDVVNCRCFLQKEVDFIAQAAVQLAVLGL